MELLIELIVWMFKAFFGDPEKTVDTTKMNRKPLLKSQKQRGPYKYGDESSNAPKTLEEILEEARRQAAERRGEMVRPTQSAQPPPVRRTVSDAPMESAPPPARTLVATPLEDDEPRAFQPVSQVQQPPPPAPKQRQRRPVEAVPLPISPPSEAPKAARAKSKKKSAQPQVLDVPDLLEAIRVAPPEAKREAARQAIVMLEVFGPPRSRRGYGRPGARSF